MSALQMINHLLSHEVRLSLQKFCIDLIHSLWLIGHLIRVVSYPGNAIVETINALLLYRDGYILYTYCHSRTTILGNITSSLPRIVMSAKHK